MELENLDNCPLSPRAGSYGGKAGLKDGIIYNNEYWIVKYPKSTADMRVKDMSYTTSPLSEYLGSQIFDILGYDVHKTFLAERRGKVAVACKDFCKQEGALREFRTLKNLANDKLSEMLEDSFSSTGDRHSINLNETLLHLEYNEILSKVPGIKERFWNTAVIDIFINNNDRNNGNWGILYENNEYKLAPIYDNGASFSNKNSDNMLEKMLDSKERMEQSTLGNMTVYCYDGKELKATDFMNLPFDELKQAIKKNVPLLISKSDEINKLFQEIPASHKGLYVCSDIRKKTYMETLNERMRLILIPVYNQCVSRDKQINPNIKFFGDSVLSQSMNERMMQASAIKQCAELVRDKSENNLNKENQLTR